MATRAPVEANNCCIIFSGTKRSGTNLVVKKSCVWYYVFPRTGDMTRTDSSCAPTKRKSPIVRRISVGSLVLDLTVFISDRGSFLPVLSCQHKYLAISMLATPGMSSTYRALQDMQNFIIS